MHYRSSTDPGNPGSPVINDEWKLFGLHYHRLPKMAHLKGKDGTYHANEEVWI